MAQLRRKADVQVEPTAPDRRPARALLLELAASGERIRWWSKDTGGWVDHPTFVAAVEADPSVTGLLACSTTTF